MSVKKIAIFASGSGSNAACITEYFKHRSDVEVALILCNNPNAYVLERAKGFGIPSLVFSREDFYHTTHIIDTLESAQIDYIILAGFLWLIPSALIALYPNKIINIHPALLPKYGGKGMYGMHVHQAVKTANEPVTGITIHYVNEQYDQGHIIFQAVTSLAPEDTPEEIAKKVATLEHQCFPKIIDEVISKGNYQRQS